MQRLNFIWVYEHLISPATRSLLKGSQFSLHVFVQFLHFLSLLTFMLFVSDKKQDINLLIVFVDLFYGLKYDPF